MTSNREKPLILIEDDEGHATLFQMYLREAGVTNPVEHFADGQTALDYVAWHLEHATPTPMVILLDLNLPVVDGYGVLSQLKSNARSRKIPVIIFTSSDDEGEIARCYELGCNAFLQKPVDFDNLVDTIKRLGLFLSLIELPKTE